MSGTITITSRGRSVGSALKAASSWSWRISTSRCGLCARWKRSDASVAGSTVRRCFADLRQRAQLQDVLLESAAAAWRRRRPRRGRSTGRSSAASGHGPRAARRRRARRARRCSRARACPRRQAAGARAGAARPAVRVRGCPGLARLPALPGAQQVLPGHDVRPVVPAGIVDADQHLRPLRHAGEHVERLQRQRGDAEHQHPPCEAGGWWRAFELARALDEGLVNAGAPGEQAGMAVRCRARRSRGIRDVRDQPPPQRRLPALVFGQRRRRRCAAHRAARPSRSPRRPASRPDRPGTGRGGRRGARPAGNACADARHR